MDCFTLRDCLHVLSAAPLPPDTRSSAAMVSRPILLLLGSALAWSSLCSSQGKRKKSSRKPQGPKKVDSPARNPLHGSRLLTLWTEGNLAHYVSVPLL